MGRNSSVGIATSYGDGRSGDRILVWGGRDFLCPSRPAPGAYPASCTVGTGSFLEVKRPGRGATFIGRTFTFTLCRSSVFYHEVRLLDTILIVALRKLADNFSSLKAVYSFAWGHLISWTEIRRTAVSHRTLNMNLVFYSNRDLKSRGSTCLWWGKPQHGQKNVALLAIH